MGVATKARQSRLTGLASLDLHAFVSRRESTEKGLKLRGRVDMSFSETVARTSNADQSAEGSYPPEVQNPDGETRSQDLSRLELEAARPLLDRLGQLVRTTASPL